MIVLYCKQRLIKRIDLAESAYLGQGESIFDRKRYQVGNHFGGQHFFGNSQFVAIQCQFYNP